MKLSLKYFLHDCLRVTAALPGLILFRPKRIYETPAAKKHIKGGALVATNHITAVDPMNMMFAIWYRRHRFVAMKELFEKNKFNKFLFSKVFLCIPIDRDNFSLKTFKEIVGYLKEGSLVTIFPEGRINENSEGFGEFKPGMILMAQKAGVPIVPVYAKRKKHFFSRLVFAIGEPIDINGLNEKFGAKNLDAMAKYVMEKLIALEKLCLSKTERKKKV